MNKKVSVLVPCYNSQAFIRKTIPSLLNQSYKNLEIILIDDGSTDDTFAILTEIAETDSRIKLYKNEINLGLINTLNKALNLSTGDFIARFDADDYLTTDRILNQINIFSNYKDVDFITSYADYYDSKGRYHSFVETFLGTTALSAKFIGLFETPLLHAGLLIKSNIIKKIKYTESQSALHVEDYVLFMNLLCEGYQLKVLTSKQNRYHYTRNANSVSHGNKNLQNENLISYSRLMIENICKIKIDDNLHRQIELRNYKDWGYLNLVNGIKLLKDIRKVYHKRYQDELSQMAKVEINTWVALRSTKMIVLTFINVPIKLKFSIVYVLFTEITIFTELRFYHSVFNRLIGILNNYKK